MKKDILPEKANGKEKERHKDRHKGRTSGSRK